MKKLISICLILILATGCCRTLTPDEREQELAQSKEKLLANPGSVCRFVVNKSYRQVFRIVHEGFYETGSIEPDEIVVKHRPEIEQVEIDYLCLGRCIARTMLHIEIKALSPDTTAYTEYYWYKLAHCDQVKRYIENH